MTNSSKRLLLLAVSIVALALSLAPVSFAGESDPGPTQVGEIQGPATPSPASQSGPSSSSGSSKSSSSNGSKGAVLGVRTTVTKDTVQAKGGVQAGFGGMATEAASLPTTLAFAGGILLLLAAAAGFTPLHRRSQD
jgi:hypothetical protein